MTNSSYGMNETNKPPKMCPYDEARPRVITQHLEDVGIAQVLAKMVVSYLPPETCEPEWRHGGSYGYGFVSQCGCTAEERSRWFLFRFSPNPYVTMTATLDPMLRLAKFDINGIQKNDFSQKQDQKVACAYCDYGYSRIDEVTIHFAHEIKGDPWRKPIVYKGPRKMAQAIMNTIEKVAEALGTLPLIQKIIEKY